MLPETQSLVDQAGTRTGKPVQVLVDGDLQVSASIQLARHGVQMHIVKVRPSDAADYFIANQVIVMLRILELPAEDQFDFVSTATADAEMAKTLRTGLMRGGQEVDVDATLVGNFTKWALMQVRSIPIGMRADQQVFRDMPTLRSSMRAGLKEQNESNLAAIQRLQGLASLPQEYFWPAATYALFTDRLTGTSLYSVPFEAMGFGRGGRELLRLYDEAPSDPAQDRTLIDAWAAHTGLAGWYRWIPYQP